MSSIGRMAAPTNALAPPVKAGIRFGTGEPDSRFRGKGEASGLEIDPAGDRFELADAFLEVGDLDPRRAFAGAAFDLAHSGAVHLQLAVLERQPVLPTLEQGGGDHHQPDQGASGN